MPLTPEDRQRIYDEEAERLRIRQELERNTSKRASGPSGCFGCCVLAVISIFSLIVYSLNSPHSSPSPASYAPDESSARIMSHEFVKKRLKAPVSAEFASEFSGDETVQDLGGGKYTVKGWVDAQNGFSAKLRNYFVCTLHNTGGTDWQADDVRLDDLPLTNPISDPPTTDWQPAHANGTSIDDLIGQVSDIPLTEETLKGFETWDLTCIRNAPYARHGYKFQNKNLRNFFNQRAWYHPTTSSQSQIDAKLSKTERDNIEKIKRFQMSLPGE